MYRGLNKKADGTFVVEYNGLPFHVTPDYPGDRYGEAMSYSAIKTYADAHPGEVADYIEPPLPAPDEGELTRTRIAELEAEASICVNYIQAGIDVDTNQQNLIDNMLEIEHLNGNIDVQ